MAAVVIGGVLGVPGAWLWVHFANPPSAPYTPNGVYLDETGLAQQSGITLWFMVIGALGGLVVGLIVGWLGQRHGWVTVLAIVLLCGAASVVSGWLGGHVFGPDPKAEAQHARPGDPITAGLSLETKVAYLGWPIGGLAGGIVTISGWKKPQHMPPARPVSGSFPAS